MKVVKMFSVMAALLLLFVACSKEKKEEKPEPAKAPAKETPAPAPPATSAQGASFENDILGKWVLEGENPAGSEFEALEFLAAGEIVYATGVKGTYQLNADQNKVTFTHPEEEEALELDLELVNDALTLSNGNQSIILKKQK